MDAWQAVQSWTIFTAAVVGLGYYYLWPNKIAEKTTAVQREVEDTKRDVKKPMRRQGNDNAAIPSVVKDNASGKEQAGSKKRKAHVPVTQQTTAVSTANDDDQADEIDMSTRQFAANMQKAREGIQVKSSNKNDSRVKTVKPKSSSANAAIASADSFHDDPEEAAPPVASSAPGTSGVDDMLEPSAGGPTSLRITAPTAPVRERTTKQAKKEVVETKKQRQNRRKAEERKQALVDEEKERRALGEQQRRAAREARGEPAKNGIAIAPAPVKNPWAEQNAARDAQLQAVDNSGNTVQLLDTLDTESNSSSNQEPSTAATSVVAEAASGRWAEANDYAKAVEQSEQESGWNEVKISRRSKTSEPNGAVTPSQAHVAKNKPKTVGGFNALRDEGEES